MLLLCIHHLAFPPFVFYFELNRKGCVLNVAKLDRLPLLELFWFLQSFFLI